jgi:hypothetical protein
VLDWFKKKRSAITGPDYSEVDSREKVQRMADEGVLVKLHLLPPEFGGDDAPPNIVYVPPFVAELKRGMEANTIMPLAQDRKITRYAASPKYQGRSFVPNAIEVRATDPGSFEAVIRIWGEALNEGTRP